MQPAGRYGTGHFGADELRASFAIARRRLGKIDALLLPGCGPEEFSPELSAVLAELSQAAGARPGYANSAVFDPATESAFPPGCIAECAIDPRWLTGKAAPPSREGLVLHSLVPTGEWLARTDPAFDAALDRAATLVPGDRATARMAALYALAAERIPGARLVFASTHLPRLQALLAAFAAIDGAGLAPRLAAEFTPAAAPGLRPAGPS